MVQKHGSNAYIEEWDGQIDLMLLIRLMNEQKRNFEKKAFKSKRGNNNNHHSDKKSELKSKSKPFEPIANGYTPGKHGQGNNNNQHS